MNIGDLVIINNSCMCTNLIGKKFRINSFPSDSEIGLSKSDKHAHIGTVYRTSVNKINHFRHEEDI